MLNTYQQLVDYFIALPTNVPGVAQVTVGADEEELNAQTNYIKYPHLRVDTPSITFVGNDENPGIRFGCRIWLMKTVPEVSNYQKENEALSEMLTLLRKVYRQIQADADADTFDLVISENSGDVVRRWSGDNLFGWYLDLQIDLPECCDC
jgi:hypothetical protein